MQCPLLSTTGESYFRALSSRLSSVDGSAHRPGRITFAGKVSGTGCTAGTSELRQGVPDAMLDNEDGIWYGDAVGSGLEGLAERNLVS